MRYFLGKRNVVFSQLLSIGTSLLSNVNLRHRDVILDIWPYNSKSLKDLWRELCLEFILGDSICNMEIC